MKICLAFILVLLFTCNKSFGQCNPLLSIVIVLEKDMPLDSMNINYTNAWVNRKKDKIRYLVSPVRGEIYTFHIRDLNIRKNFYVEVFYGGKAIKYFVSQVRTVKSDLPFFKIDYKPCAIVSYKLNNRKIVEQRPSQSIILEPTKDDGVSN